MSKLLKYLDAADTVGVLLVADGLKPTCSIEVGSAYLNGTGKRVPDSVLRKFEKELSKKGVTHFQSARLPSDGCGWEEGSRVAYDIGRDRASYEALTRHVDYSETVEVTLEGMREVGRVYGYPEDAIEFFANDVGRAQKDIALAVKRGHTLPSWMAFISHMPDTTNFPEGNFSGSSEQLGKKYEAHIRKYYPRVAKRALAQLASDTTDRVLAQEIGF